MGTATMESERAAAGQPSTPLEGVKRHTDTEQWLVVQRVVASAGFSKSVFLTNFLLHICELKLLHREAELTEHQIGTHAFERPASYHPGEDNIVRNYARILRQRLQAYFDGEGSEEPFRIVVPRGSYVPSFERQTPHAATPDVPLPLPAARGEWERSDGDRQPRRRRSVYLTSAVASTAFIVCLLLGWGLGHRQSSGAPPIASDYERFWNEVFDPTRNTYVVPADSGLAMVEDLTGRQVHLHEYAAGNLESMFANFDASPKHGNGRFGIDRLTNYTSTVDLDIAVKLATLPQFRGGHAIVRYARDIRMEDLKGANAILLGGPHVNPWDELFEPSSHFRINSQVRMQAMHLDPRTIINKRPQPGEQPAYVNTGEADAPIGYAILSFLPGADGGGYVLMLQGVNMASTQAAADFAMNPKALAPILRKARGSDGHIGAFEVLLETRIVGASAPEANPIVERYGVYQPK